MKVLRKKHALLKQKCKILETADIIVRNVHFDTFPEVTEEMIMMMVILMMIIDMKRVPQKTSLYEPTVHAQKSFTYQVINTVSRAKRFVSTRIYK